MSLPTPNGGSSEDWLCTSLFHSICKLCNLIINNSSCENVVSVGGNRELWLEIGKHLKLYKLNRLNQDNKVIMEKYYLVSFSIDKRYFNSVRYDVVSMDARHLSLGKPWQYNMNAVHDRQHNMYTLSIKGKHIALAHKREMVVI
jgi:hypothetical protein